MRAAPAEVVAGAGLLLRGARLLARRPRLFWLGAIPPALTSVLFVGVLVALIALLDPITRGLTGFAVGWSPALTGVIRVVVGVVLVGGTVLGMVLVFSTLTLALGSPIYDRISEAVDHELGGVPVSASESAVAGARRAARQTVALLAVSALGAVAFGLVGLVPLVGQVGAIGGGALFGGWTLVLELVGSPLERRGVRTLSGRRLALRRRRARTLGLGVPAFLLLSIPFVSIVIFPAATAAGTLLARDLSDDLSDDPTDTNTEEAELP